jgi:hypothetical protein
VCGYADVPLFLCISENFLCFPLFLTLFLHICISASPLVFNNLSIGQINLLVHGEMVTLAFHFFFSSLSWIKDTTFLTIWFIRLALDDEIGIARDLKQSNLRSYLGPNKPHPHLSFSFGRYEENYFSPIAKCSFKMLALKKNVCCDKNIYMPRISFRCSINVNSFNINSLCSIKNEIITHMRA